MRIYFRENYNLTDSIKLFEKELGIELCQDGMAEFTVLVNRIEEEIVSVELSDNRAEIIFGKGNARFFRGLGLLIEAIKEGKNEFVKIEKPLFETNGPMFDMSRNAVFRTSTVKYIMRRIALMGLNTLMLYTEDTYEIDEYPYFGYMRGRYTKDELRDLDSYAVRLGIELVPCVQFLGHMTMALKWPCADDYKDAEDVLLVGSDPTYELIDAMMKTISSCFSSRKLHIGMDEAHMMGRGKYMDINGYKPGFEIFCDHLNSINEMAKGYGLQLMMWSDMFFRIASKDGRYYQEDIQFPQYVIDSVPKNVWQVYWDYKHESEADYEKHIDQHMELTNNIVFAGGIWTWIGYCVHYKSTIKRSVAALGACKDKKIRDVIATIWHNGTESSLITSLPGLQLYAEYDYNGYYDKFETEKRFKFCCDAEFNDFLSIEKIDTPVVGEGGNASRMLMFNDPLIGLLDKQIDGIDTKEYYRALRVEFLYKGIGNPMFKPAFDVLRSVIDVLEHKADYGVRLKRSYDAQDRDSLISLYDEALIISDKLNQLRLAHRNSWMLYNKPFGWEVLESYYGTLIMRFATARDRIMDYLEGRIKCIEELEEKKLRYDCKDENEPKRLISSGNKFQRIYSACATYATNGSGG